MLRKPKSTKKCLSIDPKYYSSFDEKAIVKELKIHAKALKLPPGSADIFIERTMSSVKLFLETKHYATQKDIDRLIVKELKKYHANLAYVYENHDKII